MAKGKKFTAAEKHFAQKRVELDRKIKHLSELTNKQAATIASQDETIRKLKDENLRLNDWIERLLEYTELSKEDIKAACEKDKKLNGLLSFFGTVSKFI